MSNWSISHAAYILKQGGVIAYPTEAVFGLGCLPNKLDSVQHLLDLKQRPMEKGLILIADNLEQLLPYIASLDSNVLKKIQAPTSVPTTWIVPTPSSTSPLLRGKFQSIAIRITDHPVVKQLCQKIGSPIISTSANITGKHMTYNAFQVRLHFQNQLDYILNASLGQSNKPSVIKDVLTDRVIRG